MCVCVRVHTSLQRPKKLNSIIISAEVFKIQYKNCLNLINILK